MGSAPEHLSCFRNHLLSSPLIFRLSHLNLLVLSVDNLAEDAAKFLNELDEVVRELSLILVAVSDSLILYKPNVVLNFWHEAAAKHAVFLQESLEDFIRAREVPYNLQVQLLVVVYCLMSVAR